MIEYVTSALSSALPPVARVFCLCSALGLGVFGCRTNPNKPVEEKTILQNSQDVGAGQLVGQNEKGEVVTQKKKKLADRLREIEARVYALEAEIYGHEDYGRKGLYGVLQECLDKSGELRRLPEKAILTKSEDQWSGKMVLDEGKNLVNVSEEFFLDRIKRFENYKESYDHQKDDFTEKVRICEFSKK